MKKVILCVSNDLTIDQRLHKVCTTLQSHHFNPVLLGVKKADSLPLLPRSYKCVRVPLFFSSGKLFYAEVNIRFFFYLLFSRADILTANDLDTIIPCYLVSVIKRIRLVYDSHEYFTEVPELQNRKLEKAIWTLIEKFIFPKLRHVSTVGNSIAGAYQEKYKVDVKVVKNLPFKKSMITGNKKKGNIMLYQGAVNMGRGLELMIKAMEFLPGFELWIVGEGPVYKSLRDNEYSYVRVKFFGKRTFQELYDITAEAVIGLSLEEDLGLNYRFALPNKIFDYLNAGVPVIVSNLPEMRSLVETYQVGMVLKERTPEGLAEMARSMSQDKTRYDEFVSNCHAASGELNWETQEPVLLSLYN